MTNLTRKRMIKARLKMRDLTYKDIGAAAGVNWWTVSTIINRFPEKKSYKVQKAIALAIGKDFTALWGVPDAPPRRRGVPKERGQASTLPPEATKIKAQTPYLERAVNE